MKLFIIVFLMAASTIAMAQNGKASTTKKTFSRETTVSILIDASIESVWDVLVKASEYQRWNSTIISLEGTIQKGEKLRLKSTLDPSRAFKLKVKEMIPNQRMVWGDAMGKRVYQLDYVDNQTSRFTMNEKIGGLMFPLFAKKIPSFDKSFQQFAADLKKEVESKS